jgi:branched-chain amino acid transport system permease protein
LNFFLILIEPCLIALLCLGFSFTYNMEKFPNFAQIGLAAMGSMITFYLVVYLGFSPYLAAPFAAGFCGIFGVFLYLNIVRPLRRHGGYRDITLTLAFLAVSLILRTFYFMFSYWSSVARKIPGRGYNVSLYDFIIFDMPGIAIVAPIACIVLVITLYLFLTRNSFGVTLRAVAEDESLAAILGIDTYRTHIASWLLVGTLAGFAGSLLSIDRGMSSEFDILFVIVMAGSFIGGINSVFGAAVGGFSISLIMNWLPGIAKSLIGSYKVNLLFGSFDIYSLTTLLPYLVLYIVLIYEPEGIIGLLVRLRSYFSNRSRGKANISKK